MHRGDHVCLVREPKAGQCLGLHVWGLYTQRVLFSCSDEFQLSYVYTIRLGCS